MTKKADTVLETEPGFKPVYLIAFMVFLALALFSFSFLFQSAVPRQTEQKNISYSMPYSLPNASRVLSSVSMEQCLSSYGVNPNSILVIYGDMCPYDRLMDGPMATLTQEGYSFEKIFVDDSKSVAIMEECLSSIISMRHPQFICVKTRSEKTGELSIDELRSFASKCL